MVKSFSKFLICTSLVCAGTLTYFGSNFINSNSEVFEEKTILLVKEGLNEKTEELKKKILESYKEIEDLRINYEKYCNSSGCEKNPGFWTLLQKTGFLQTLESNSPNDEKIVQLKEEIEDFKKKIDKNEKSEEIFSKIENYKEIIKEFLSDKKHKEFLEKEISLLIKKIEVLSKKIEKAIEQSVKKNEIDDWLFRTGIILNKENSNMRRTMPLVTKSEWKFNKEKIQELMKNEEFEKISEDLDKLHEMLYKKKENNHILWEVTHKSNQTSKSK